uniref:RUN domain-containing protein n=1 Tax=Heterorhabditis bacteriophora TaxID=37862 RepID=A0A1I7XN01_HETBA
MYWRFVSEFLPKTQQNMIRAEWGDIDNRRLSIAWLKDAFNKGTLHFQLLAFKSNKSVISRYYHKNACMSNGGMLEAVTELVLSLYNVQFAFYSTLNLRMEPVQAVVVEPPTTPLVKVTRAKRRKQTDNDITLHSITDTVPATIHESVLPTPIDQEIILDELVRSRRNRMHGFVDRFSHGKSEESTDSTVKSADSFEHSIREEGLDELAMDVFIEQGEKLLKMYNVYERFAVGTPQQRLLTITDHNIYIIFQNVAVNEGSWLGGSEDSVRPTISYYVYSVIPIPSIDYIGVGVDAQVIIFYSKKSSEFQVVDGDKKSDKICAVSTGDKQLGNTIIKTIGKAAENSNQSSPMVFTESTPYTLILKRYLTKELCGSPHLELNYLSLVYWKESSAFLDSCEMEHTGYLYRRGSKMYVFTDSSCKEGEMVINLNDCTDAQELDLKRDCQWALELILPDGNLQLQCPSKEEMYKWLQLVSTALNSHGEDEAAACMMLITDTHLVVAQEGEKCFNDGFIRTLVCISLPDIRSGWIVRTEIHMVLLLRVDDHYQWFFFRSEEELDRFITTLVYFAPRFANVDRRFLTDIGMNTTHENCRKMLHRI